MKKSQISAALALAFALGVVAPVAGVNALTHDDANTTVDEGAATLKELQTAIAAVKANTTYNNIATWKNEAAKLSPVAPATVAEYQEAGRGLIDNITYYWTDANVNSNAVANAQMTKDVITADLAGTAATPANIKKTIEIAKNTDGYTAFSGLINAINSKSNIAGAILALNQYLYGNDVAQYFAYNADAVALYVSTTNNPVANDNGIGAKYSWFLGLVTAVNNSDVAVKSYETGLANLKNAAFAEGVLSAASAETLENNFATNPYPALSDLAGFVNANVQNYATWQNVMTAVANAEKATARTSEGTNYDYLIALARAYGNATNDIKSLTVEQIADKLVAYTAPETPNNPDTETPGDDTKDPSAPGTGLVGTAEGNAATTVSIVAGLATALTALGAGVVAYRSARRSNK